MQGTKTPELLSVTEAAQILGTSTRFPRRLIAERAIKHYKVGRHVRIARQDLLEYLESNSRQVRG